MRVKKFENLGYGASKQAFTLQESLEGAPYNYTIPDGSDITKFCIVKYTNTIDWKNESEFPKSFQDFKRRIASDPRYNYDIFYADEIPYGEDATVLKSNKKLYRNHKIQFECTDELRKMRDLGELFAPKLHQIRIDTQSNTGIPFPPEELDSKFEEIPSGIVTVSYLVERCDDSVIKFVVKNPDKKPEVAAKMIEFIDSYVERQNELNCDIKSDNFCPKIIEGRVISIRLLDVDPKFCIKGYTPDFKQNAKVFMKYAFITHSVKWGQKIGNRRATINFGNMGITQNDVDAAIRFFYRPEYMVYEFNPINMLYHYFVNLDPGNFVELPGWEIQIIETTNDAGEKNKVKQFRHIRTQTITKSLPYEYEFLSYDKLILYFRENLYKIIELFKELNKEIGIVLLSGGGGGPSKAVARPDEKESIEKYSKDIKDNAPYKEEGAIDNARYKEEDTTDNARYKEEDATYNEPNKEDDAKGAKGGRRKRKSKKRKNRKRKYTRKA